ncbi:MAG TPA: FtsX-like permease family protein [Vicinamibacteria bacterium]|nr:FtsX-like permease family protein [Vicinamibacteria bacterium]
MANLAAANVMHRKTRTAVSVLAVAMEVAMVMLLVGLANGTLGDIADRLQNVGADVLFQPPDASLLLGATSAVMPLKYAEIMKSVDGVTEVTPVLNWHVSNIKGESRAVNLWAIDYPSFARISGGFDVLQGRPLEKPYDLVMDTVLADATGIHAGDKLPMINRDFTVVGIIRAGAGGRLYARLADVQEAIGTPDRASFFLVKGRSSLEADKLAQALQARFPGHKITPVAQVSKVMQDNATGLKQFKQALTGMAVVISFLVVLLAMYTTIIERTREIGILRAIGASQAKVVQLVINESTLICLAGVAMGILFAVAGRWLLPQVFPTLTVQLTREWALIASALGLGGGLLGSFYPAIKAARMDPIQALNFE